VRYTESRYAERHSAECRGAVFFDISRNRNRTLSVSNVEHRLLLISANLNKKVGGGGEEEKEKLGLHIGISLYRWFLAIGF